MRFLDKIPIWSNVHVSKISPTGDIVDERKTHNVLINVGRKWLRNVVGASAYPAGVDPLPITGFGGPSGAARTKYIGLGVGGALQTGAFLNTQTEVVTVSQMEDPVLILPDAISGDGDKWLKQVAPQNVVEAFPTDFSISFVASFLETEVSFTPGQMALGSSTMIMGPSVPISEAGLFVSTADEDVDPLTAPNNVSMIAYNIFEPITKTPNFVLRVAWTLRF